MIGCVCKSGDIFSLAVLIDRGLDLTSQSNHKHVISMQEYVTGFGGTFGNNLYSVFRVYKALNIVGVDGGEGTPVPIPNTAVKLTCADNTWLVAAREDK